jgi:hypothetical protein
VNWNPSPLRQRQPRERSGAYCAWIARGPCVACMAYGRGARYGVQVAHVRTGSLAHDKRPTGAGEKPSDWWTTPLCEPHHREQHTGAELAFWARVGVDVFTLCKDLRAAYDAGGTPVSVVARYAGQAQRQRRNCE